MEALCKIIACLLNEMSDPNSRVVQEWKNFQYDNSMNCKLTHCDFYQEDSIQQINVKEVHTREQAAMEDCTNVVDSINQAEMTNRKNSDEKTEQFTPTIVTGGKVARTLEVHIQFNQIPTILAQRWLEFQQKCDQPEAMHKGSSYFDRVMPKPSIFKEVHLPYMSRLLIERKRHTSSWKPWKKKLKLSSSSNKIAAIKADIGKLRHKREMHIMMARYREEIKGSRKTKRKTSTSRPSSNGNKNMSVPHSILNVSFTGSWDPPPKTTVKPRVGRPLKMTPEDMEFVHGKKPEKKRQRGGLKIVLETS
ncbi:unnamed protein product [Orchesella dallaii]|uniref:Uncharacterized protein n=1 Tax=Orchesella dallaii TaxID=48710 RepID=A0ABP1QYB6_9HEXA